MGTYRMLHQNVWKRKHIVPKCRVAVVPAVAVVAVEAALRKVAVVIPANSHASGVSLTPAG